MTSQRRTSRTVISLEPQELVRLAAIIADEDKEEALRFLVDCINEKLKCAQAETHRPAFEGGTGTEPAHYLQKGEGAFHPAPEKPQEAG